MITFKVFISTLYYIIVNLGIDHLKPAEYEIKFHFMRAKLALKLELRIKEKALENQKIAG
jgi:hypothetical protein